jgi:hypothetical protein
MMIIIWFRNSELYELFLWYHPFRGESRPAIRFAWHKLNWSLKNKGNHQEKAEEKQKKNKTEKTGEKLLEWGLAESLYHLFDLELKYHATGTEIKAEILHQHDDVRRHKNEESKTMPFSPPEND